MFLRALIDGVASDCLPVTDRGLQYGDGLFETIAVRAGVPCLWRAHFDRLAQGANRLGIPCPSEDQLRRECWRLGRDESAAVLKIILTRGSGGRGYRVPEIPQPSRILMLYPWPDYPRAWAEQGVDVVVCRARLGENVTLAGIKHLNRLEQILARSEWQDPQIAEGLMQDGRERVIGGTMSNLFLVRDGRLLTPRLDSCGIAGTVRALVLGMADVLGVDAVETDLTGEDLRAANGAFLTNALIGVWPVHRLGGREIGLHALPSQLIARVREQYLRPELKV